VFTRAIDIADPEDPYLAALLGEVHRGRQENPDGSTTLWRPVGSAELDLLRAADMRAWLPRLPDQPIFYPVLGENDLDELNRHLIGPIEVVETL
jgi:hypothetical protein